MFGLFGRKAVGQISPEDAHRRHTAGEVELVDVREAHEWESGHIPGARHAALSTLDAKIHELPRDRPLVLYCLSGMRSGRALKMCQNAGFTDVASMAGGIGAWRHRGYPVRR
ncbi:rhodanese-like domain-containing protein [Phreatobacter aquaticus]|uniref:Rhodanese-like domain-containing protein n=1 Tax=Phreatobacter aquaticus TaxID=2570229 RepID=A0A4D7QD30_9HYPH|nr:rhodanese-like domain-containing protein [Phreatobacter aquaticus]QCK85910.1 rhodanese-like domain-containing protein [Phreatobacter aquaticus]